MRRSVKNTCRFMVILGFLMAGVSSSANAEKWSDYVIVSTQDDILVSSRQRLQQDGWFVEWKVENNSADCIEPYAKSRTYACKDENTTILEQKTLGPYPPDDQRQESIRDRRICPNSEIRTVTVDLELRPVSEIIRKMWE